MSVGRDYLVGKPSGPSPPKLFLNAQVVPLLVNGVGAVEVALDRVAVRTGVRPAVILAGGAGLLSVVALAAMRRRVGARR